MNLSEHFTLAEMAFSEIALRKGLDNTPNDEQIDNLISLCENLLEPARLLLDAPFHVTSGFRSKVINRLVGGAVDSVHPEGLACDFKPYGWKLEDAFDVLRLSPRLIYDQVIIECGTWIHISQPRSGVRARREMLVAKGTPGNWTYQNIT